METRAFVLLSGGIDSSTLLGLAVRTMEAQGLHRNLNVEGVAIDYKQRHIKELRYAATQCADFEVPMTTIKIGAVLDGGMLTDPNWAIPNASYDDIEGVSPAYVPYRNGTLLSIATARAQAWTRAAPRAMIGGREALLYFGANAEDARNWAYPDCTPEFIGAMANAIYIGTHRTVRLVTPLMWSTKSEIIKRAVDVGVDLGDTWSCYAGGEVHCGTCMTCRARKQGFAEAGIDDPTVYAV